MWNHRKLDSVPQIGEEVDSHADLDELMRQLRELSDRWTEYDPPPSQQVVYTNTTADLTYRPSITTGGTTPYGVHYQLINKPWRITPGSQWTTTGSTNYS